MELGYEKFTVLTYLIKVANPPSDSRVGPVRLPLWSPQDS